MIGIIHPVDGKVYELVKDSLYRGVCEDCEFNGDSVATKLCTTQPKVTNGYTEDTLCVTTASHYAKPNLD